MPKKNDIIYCEHCNRNLYILLNDVKRYDKVAPKNLEPISPQTQVMNTGQFMNCCHCGNRIGFKTR